MKHTKSPWRISKEIYKDENMCPVPYYEICGQDITWVAHVSAGGYLKDEGEAEANAKLIAAAPELLECLEDVLATRHLMMVQSPSKVELNEILAIFERVRVLVSKIQREKEPLT